MTVNAGHLLYVITFDFKQNIAIPYDPIQPSCYFYNSKRSCNVFGVCHEGRDEIDIYLYDELNGAKTADQIISMLELSIKNIPPSSYNHMMDNCSGQNKNHYLVAYAIYLTQVRKICTSLRMKYLVVGHTHNNVDRCFASLENVWRKQQIHYHFDALNAAKNLSGMNVKEMEGFYYYREVINNVFTDLKGIKKAFEICILLNDPLGTVHYTTKTLACSVFPCKKSYEKEKVMVKNDVSLEKITLIMRNVRKVEKETLSLNKIKSLRDYYLKGVVRKELHDYYGFENDELWATQKE
jgi:hypothetical protein